MRILLSVLACAALLATARSGAAQTAPVAVARAETAEIIAAVRLNGTVVSPRVAEVSSDVGGLVDTVAVELGDRVAEGDPLAQLDQALGRLDLDRAAAEKREARARLADARRQLEDAEELVARDTLPRNELEARKAAVQVAEARVERLEAAEAHQRARLERHTIRAPFAGVVARTDAEAGEWVEPGTAIVELVMTHGLLVEVPVPQRHYGAVLSGVSARLAFESAPGRAFEAEVAARIPVSDPTARTFLLRLRLADERPALTPGMSARVTLRLATGERGVVIPRDALVRHPDGRTTVWVVEEEGEKATVETRRVEIDQSFDGMIEITEGLEAGARVVTRGNESLTPGQTVRITDGAS